MPVAMASSQWSAECSAAAVPMLNQSLAVGGPLSVLHARRLRTLAHNNGPPIRYDRPLEDVRGGGEECGQARMTSIPASLKTVSWLSSAWASVTSVSISLSSQIRAK